MAPLPVNSTMRVFIDYRVAGTDQHTAMFRFNAADTTEEVALLKIHDILEEFDNVFYTDTVFESARVAQQGQDASFPFGWEPITGTASTTGRPVDYRARFLSFVGRSADARNWHSSLFGATLIPDANFIILDSEAPALASMRDALLSDPNPVTTISDLVIIPLNYFTTRVSSYWQKRIARTG